ncbi:MAG: PatB family C-S lyase [Candidatus Marinimicrobia bacterium]|jgi:cystathionine beta-lyase|nr:PatB family C-S lyase [Candidatus Neomarinimicrobiota bacterium]MDD5709410.1 PatB family C-S lyase [Candidatus Neomarinimicrobiota bacterium]MDX9777288.1 PatB family C-S lyase [bacterium]
MRGVVLLNRRIDRYNTDCLKYDAVENVFGTRDVIPLWVADMDIPAPKAVRKALIRRVRHPVYGYSLHNKCFYESIIKWLEQRFDYHVEKEWITCTPGIVPAINIAIMALSEPGDEIIIQPPVYPPFFSAVTDQHRTLVSNPLKEKEGRYEMDFEDLESKISKKTRMLILCNPHNPVGRVFTRKELSRLGDICRKNNIIIVSDEIHADIVYKPNKHIPIASIDKKYADITITCMAPSKTFNIAGFATSEIIIENEEVRREFRRITQILHICNGNILGDAALIASYRHGRQWLKELMELLEHNIDFVISFARDYIPSLKILRPESTFLLWLDCREWGLSQKELNDFFIHEAKLGLNDGKSFGDCGEGFMRMNIGTCTCTLKKAMKQLQTAAEKRGLI